MMLCWDNFSRKLCFSREKDASHRESPEVSHSYYLYTGCSFIMLMPTKLHCRRELACAVRSTLFDVVRHHSLDSLELSVSNFMAHIYLPDWFLPGRKLGNYSYK